MNEPFGMTRREALLRTGQGILAAGLMAGAVRAASASLAPPDTKPVEPATPPRDEPALPPDQRVGFAICGLGKYATENILPAFSDCRKARLVGFVSGDTTKAQKLASQYGVDPKSIVTYDRIGDLKNNAAVEVIYVITPNATHKQYVLAAAQANKHVMCEKPMATNASDCEIMIKAVRDVGKKLMIGYRAQYEPFNRECIRLCRSGELGRLVTISADHGRQVEPDKDKADTWRVKKALSGGGSLVDIGIYNLNAARYLTGEEPTEISARWETPKNDPRFKEVEATVHWTMRFPSGTLANCASSYDWLDTKRFRVQGSDGWLELDPATDYWRHRLRIGRKGKGEETIVEEPQIKEQSQFALMLDHFAECVKSDKTPQTPGEEGLRDVRYMEMIYEAAHTGKIIRV